MLDVKGTYLYGAAAGGNRLLGVVQFERNKNPLAKQFPGFEFGDATENEARTRKELEEQTLDEQGVAHVKMLGACIDCPISILTMKLGIQRLLKEQCSEISGVNAITDVSIADLYRRQAVAAPADPPAAAASPAGLSVTPAHARA